MTSRQIAARGGLCCPRGTTPRGGPLMFVQSAGCCAGSVPMCFPAGEYLTGQSDLLLGLIEGCPFYMDMRQYEAWHPGQLILDVEPGPPEGFSLAAGEDLHFITRGGPCTRAPRD